MVEVEALAEVEGEEEDVEGDVVVAVRGGGGGGAQPGSAPEDGDQPQSRSLSNTVF